MKTSRIYGVWLGLSGAVAVSLASLLTPAGLAQETVASSVAWRQFLDFFRQEREDQGSKSPGISRGDICPVSLVEDAMIWHTTPLLVWRGRSFPTTGIRQLAQSPPAWTETATDADAGVWRLAYAATPLEAGGHYEWLFYLRGVSNPASPTRWVRFRVLDGDNRDRVSTELANLQTRWESEGADEEAIALGKAIYFIENDLPSDAVQVVFAVGEPSAALVETREALVEEVCAGDRDRVEELRRRLLGR